MFDYDSDDDPRLSDDYLTPKQELMIVLIITFFVAFFFYTKEVIISIILLFLIFRIASFLLIPFVGYSSEAKIKYTKSQNYWAYVFFMFYMYIAFLVPPWLNYIDILPANYIVYLTAAISLVPILVTLYLARYRTFSFVTAFIAVALSYAVLSP